LEVSAYLGKNGENPKIEHSRKNGYLPKGVKKRGEK
jgi:hypothetical protein